MSALKYSSASGLLLSKDGHLCTTCCTPVAKIIGTWWPVYPYHYDTQTPIFNLESLDFWGDGVAIGYIKWRFYSRPGGYYPPNLPNVWVNYSWVGPSNYGDWQDYGPGRFPPGSGVEGDITVAGRLTYLQRYLSSFSVQYSGGSPVELPAVILLCVSPDGTSWPTLG